MKTRAGFVSNSSSSSFIIGVKGELTEEKIMKAFSIDENSPLYGIAKSIAVVLMDATSYTLAEFIKDRYYDDISELGEVEKKIFDKGFKFYSGYASDDSGGVGDSALCDIDLDYEDEDLILFKEAGY